MDVPLMGRLLLFTRSQVESQPMCHIFAGQDPGNYAYETRSVRLMGHATSVRLEAKLESSSKTSPVVTVTGLRFR
jgi:hypothetical protein